MLRQSGHTWIQSLKISKWDSHRLPPCTFSLMVQVNSIRTRRFFFFWLASPLHWGLKEQHGTSSPLPMVRAHQTAFAEQWKEQLTTWSWEDMMWQMDTHSLKRSQTVWRAFSCTTLQKKTCKDTTHFLCILSNRFPQQDKYTRPSHMRTGYTTDNYSAFAARCWFASASAQLPSISMATQRNSRVIQGWQGRKFLWPCCGRYRKRDGRGDGRGYGNGRCDWWGVG